MKRISLYFINVGNLTIQEMINCAQSAEQNGFDGVWVGEVGWKDALTVCSMLAANTSRLKVGTAVVGIYGRSPVTMAMTVASLDELSTGRFVLGLGTQPPVYVEKWHSMKFEKPLTRMKEYVTIVREILTRRRVTFEGRTLRVENFELYSKPMRERVPIYIGAIGPNMIRVAGEVGDGVIGNLYTVDYVRDVVAKNLEIGAKRAGRDLSEIDVAGLLISCVSKDSKTAKDAAKPQLAMYVSLPYYTPILVHSGFTREMNLVRDAIARGDLEAAFRNITDEMVDTFTVSGTPDECRTRLEQYRDVGLKLPVLYPIPPPYHSPYPSTVIPHPTQLPAKRVYDAAIEAVAE